MLILKRVKFCVIISDLFKNVYMNKVAPETYTAQKIIIRNRFELVLIQLVPCWYVYVPDCDQNACKVSFITSLYKNGVYNNKFLNNFNKLPLHAIHIMMLLCPLLIPTSQTTHNFYMDRNVTHFPCILHMHCKPKRK